MFSFDASRILTCATGIPGARPHGLVHRQHLQPNQRIRPHFGTGYPSHTRTRTRRHARTRVSLFVDMSFLCLPIWRDGCCVLLSSNVHATFRCLRACDKSWKHTYRRNLMCTSKQVANHVGVFDDRTFQVVTFSMLLTFFFSSLGHAHADRIFQLVRPWLLFMDRRRYSVQKHKQSIFAQASL